MSRTTLALQPAEVRTFGVVAEMRNAASADTPRMGASARPVVPQRPVEVPTASPVHTARFSLRPLVVGDRDEFLRVLRASPHVDRFLPLRVPGEHDEGAFARQLNLTRLAHTSQGAWRRIAVNAQGRIVGGFNLINIERGLAWRADANWWVAGDCLRQRIATECVYAMLDVALADAPQGLGLHEVSAHVQCQNEASLRLVSRVGLRAASEPEQTLQIGEHWLLHRTFVKSVLDRA